MHWHTIDYLRLFYAETETANVIKSGKMGVIFNGEFDF